MRGTPMNEDPRYEQYEADEAAREAAAIGGKSGDEELDPAQRAVIEAGGGESEGFEQSEQALIEHASHADQQSAHAILHHQGRPEEAGPDVEESGDHEQSSQRDAD